MLTIVALGVLSLAPAQTQSDLARGEALAQAGDHEGAIDVLFGVIDDCAASEAEVARAYLTLGWSESALERDDNARRSFAEALLVDKAARLPDSAPERSKSLLESVKRDGAEPWGKGRLVIESVPPVAIQVDGKRLTAPAELSPPFGDVVILTNPPLTVELSCRRLGVTRVDVYLVQAMRVKNNGGQTALIATGATLMGMGAVIGIVGLAVFDPADPEASAVLGIVGGAFLVGGAIPLGIAGINHAVTPPLSHIVNVQTPGGASYETYFDPTTGLPRSP